jgi:cobalt ECF transporter T component CbiQ
MTAPARADRRTPDWLLAPEVGLCPCGCIGKRRKGSYLAKTLAGGADLVRRTMFSDESAGRPGLLQRLDPRVALASVLALLIAIGLVRNLPVLAAAYAGTLLLAAASGLSVWFFVRRVWLFVPVFTGIVVLPATLSVITRGRVVLTLWHWHGQAEGFTAQGLHAAGLIVTRVATSISLVVLLTLTTKWPRLLAALRALGVPRIFVLITGMAYRYLYLLLGTVSDMFTARKARTLGGDGGSKEGRRFVAASVGTLFGKAHQLSDEVYQAMTARGFRGYAVTTAEFRLRAVDAAWTAVTVLAVAALLLSDRALGR